MTHKLETVKINVEIVKTKLLTFLAIAGGSWVYAYKSEHFIFLILWISFAINAFGVFINLVKLGKLQTLVKELS